MDKKETQASENGMLKLAGELRELTSGLCRVGPGPFGFGVHNCRLSQLGCVICLDPDPYAETPLSGDVSEYKVTVQPINSSYSDERPGEPVGMDRVRELAESGDPATRLVAQALVKLAPNPVTITRQEDAAAYDSMVFDTFYDGDKMTESEANRLCELRWHEGRTPQEIVDFQLFEERLCMPLEEFRTAVEAVLGRSVEPDELQSGRQDLQAEYRAVWLSEGSQSEMEQQDPCDGLAPLTM